MTNWKAIERVIEQNVMPRNHDVFEGIDFETRKELVAAYIAAARELDGPAFKLQQFEQKEDAAARLVCRAVYYVNQAGYALMQDRNYATHWIGENGLAQVKSVSVPIPIVDNSDLKQPCSKVINVTQPRGFLNMVDYARTLIEGFRNGAAGPTTIKDALAPILG